MNSGMYVEVYSMPTCMPCMVIKSLLKDGGIPFTDYSVEDNPDKALKANVMLSVPVTILYNADGTEVSRGKGIDAEFLESLKEFKDKIK